MLAVSFLVFVVPVYSQDPMDVNVVNIPHVLVDDVLDHSLVVEKPVPVVNVYKKCSSRNPKPTCDDIVLFSCVDGGVIEKGQDEETFYWRCETTCIPGDDVGASVTLNRRQSGECSFKKPQCGDVDSWNNVTTAEGRWSCNDVSMHIERLEQRVDLKLIDGTETGRDVYDRWQCGRSTGGNLNSIVLSDICEKEVPKRGECSFETKYTCKPGDSVVGLLEENDLDRWQCVGNNYDSDTGDFRGVFPYYRKDYVTTQCQLSKEPTPDWCDLEGEWPGCSPGRISNLEHSVNGLTSTWRCANEDGAFVSCSKSNLESGFTPPPPPTDGDVKTEGTVSPVYAVKAGIDQRWRSGDGKEITLTWKKPESIKVGDTGKYQYGMYDGGEERWVWKDVPESDLQTTTTYTITTDSITNTPLDPDVRYSLRVRAVGLEVPVTSGSGSAQNMCGSREERLRALVPEFFIDKGGVCTVGDSVLGGKYKTSGCKLGNIAQEDADFIVSRSGGEVKNHLIVYVTCRFGSVVKGNDGKPVLDENEKRVLDPTEEYDERVTVHLLPYQDNVSFSVDGKSFFDSFALSKTRYGDSVECEIDRVCDKDTPDIDGDKKICDETQEEIENADPSLFFSSYILDQDLKTDIVTISRINPIFNTLASVLETVMGKYDIPLYYDAPDRGKIMGASVYLTYLWGHYTGLIKMPYYSINSLLSSPLLNISASFLDPDASRARNEVIQDQNNKDLERYEILSHIFATESDPRFREQNFGFMTPEEARGEYINAYEGRLKYYIGSSLGSFIFKVPSGYR